MAQRREIAAVLDESLADIDGITPTVAAPGDQHPYWRYVVHVDRDQVPGGPDAIAAALRPLGIPSAPRYIAKPAFRCGVFADQKTMGSSRWPFTVARAEAVDYAADRFPGTFAFLDSVLVLTFNERYTHAHAEFVANGLRAAVADSRRAGE